MRILDWDTGSRAELAAFITALLNAGFWEYDDVLEWVSAWADDSGVVPLDEAAALLQRSWHERLAEQATWTDTGDFGRLERAFAELEGDGVVARMCFSCCQSCAFHEIADERSHDESGYAYFHESDAQVLGTDDATLYLAFGSFDPEAADDVTVGAQVAAAARRHGLDVEWSGSPSERVALHIREWRKPLPA